MDSTPRYSELEANRAKQTVDHRPVAQGGGQHFQAASLLWGIAEGGSHAPDLANADADQSSPPGRPAVHPTKPAERFILPTTN